MRLIKIFEISASRNNNKTTYLFASNGLNDDKNLSYKKMTLWRFLRNDFEINLIQVNNFVVCAFGISDELINFLNSKNVKTKSFKIQSQYGSLKNKFSLDDESVLEVWGGGGWKCAFELRDKNDNRIFHLDSNNHKEPLSVFNQSVKLIFSNNIDSKNPPEIVEIYYRNLKSSNKTNKFLTGCGNIMIFILLLIAVISIIALVFNQ